MTELSRNLLAAAREGLDPSADVAARVRAKVAATIAASSTGAVVAITAASKPAVASPVVAAPVVAKQVVVKTAAVKVIGTFGLIATLAAIFVLTRPDGEAIAPRLGSTPSHVDEPAGSVQLASSESAVAPAATAPSAVSGSRPGGSGVRVSEQVSQVSPDPSLAREVELIDRAMVALRRGDTAVALSTVALFERETRGHGQMREDAAAIAIEAHCRLGDDVRLHLAAFDRAWPSSAQRARITAACRR